MSEANESTCGVTESRTVPCGGSGSGRSLSVVGNARSRELCEALEIGGAGCLLRYESSALLMTAQLRHGPGLASSVAGRSEALQLQHTHERRLTNNHSRPHPATINTTMMLHGGDAIDVPSAVDDVAL